MSFSMKKFQIMVHQLYMWQWHSVRTSILWIKCMTSAPLTGFGADVASGVDGFLGIVGAVDCFEIFVCNYLWVGTCRSQDDVQTVMWRFFPSTFGTLALTVCMACLGCGLQHMTSGVWVAIWWSLICWACQGWLCHQGFDDQMVLIHHNQAAWIVEVPYMAYHGHGQNAFYSIQVSDCPWFVGLGLLCRTSWHW